MTDAISERRKHPRRQCFFIHADRERIPVWVFSPPDDADSHVGLILDMSESGVRVLTAADHPLESSRFSLTLLVERGGASGDPLSEADGNRGQVSGLHFEDGAEAAAAFIVADPPSARDRSWIRCTLRPIN